MLSTASAVLYSFVMGLVILLCRALPFIIFGKQDPGGERRKKTDKFLSFVERVVPPVAMTVLACNAMVSPVREQYQKLLPVLAASAFTGLAHVWKRNSLISIAGGTALYIILTRLW